MIVRGLAAAALVGGCVLTATACGNGGSPAHDHGKVVARLPIPFTSRVAAETADVIKVTVAVGQRFSVKVATSDGPFYWSQAGAAPDPRLVKVAGDFNDGQCAANLVGCRVPFFHTLLARGKGTTTMSWLYHNLACAAGRKASGRTGHSCVRTAAVRFEITVR
jgi:hypothetical protein